LLFLVFWFGNEVLRLARIKDPEKTRARKKLNVYGLFFTPIAGGTGLT
jgi:hypothetical protein